MNSWIKTLLVLTFIVPAAYAWAASNTGSDSDIEMRARKVGESLRCVVCQNQSIEESDASLAEDMRRLVRARMRAGDTDAEVVDYLRGRYGDYVLLKPPVQGNTLMLWGLPFGLLIVGIIWFTRQRYQARGLQTETVSDPFSDAERETLARLKREGPQP